MAPQGLLQPFMASHGLLQPSLRRQGLVGAFLPQVLALWPCKACYSPLRAGMGFWRHSCYSPWPFGFASLTTFFAQAVGFGHSGHRPWPARLVTAFFAQAWLGVGRKFACCGPSGSIPWNCPPRSQISLLWALWQHFLQPVGGYPGRTAAATCG